MTFTALSVSPGPVHSCKSPYPIQRFRIQPRKPAVVFNPPLKLPDGKRPRRAAALPTRGRAEQAPSGCPCLPRGTRRPPVGSGRGIPPVPPRRGRASPGGVPRTGHARALPLRSRRKVSCPTSCTPRAMASTSAGTRGPRKPPPRPPPLSPCP